MWGNTTEPCRLKANVTARREADSPEVALLGETLHGRHRAAEKLRGLGGRDEEAWFDLRRHACGIDALGDDARRYPGGVTEPTRNLLSEAEAQERDDRLRAAGITVTTPSTATITLLKRPTAREKAKTEATK